MKNIKVNLPSPSGFKAIEATFPTDAQWTARARKLNHTMRRLGRGKGQSVTPNEHEVNLDLFNEIKVSGPELDKYEATEVINVGLECEIGDDTLKGDNCYTMTIRTPQGQRTCTVKSPSVAQKRIFRESFSVPMWDRNGATVSHYNLNAAAELFKEIGSDEDQPLPIIYKVALISEVISLTEAEAEELMPAENDDPLEL